MTDHGEEREVIRIWEMGGARGGRSARGSGNPVGEDLHREKAGNCGSVGGGTYLI